VVEGGNVLHHEKGRTVREAEMSGGICLGEHVRGECPDPVSE